MDTPDAHSIAHILAAATPAPDGLRATIPAHWLQGRTSYGGLSSALALQAAQRTAPDLPPLRSAQISFIGPLAGDVSVAATLLRRGRNAAFVQSDIRSEAGLGYRATFVFMHAQSSRIDLDIEVPPQRDPPAEGTKRYIGPADHFTGRFEFVDIKDPALGPAEWLRWARLRERDGLDPMVELVAIADALPPGAYKLLGREQAPLSSMTWILNLLTPAPATADGWWLLSARSSFARDGCSSQTMTVWNAAGQRIAEGMQSVAIFA